MEEKNPGRIYEAGKGCKFLWSSRTSTSQERADESDVDEVNGQRRKSASRSWTRRQLK